MFSFPASSIPERIDTKRHIANVTMALLKEMSLDEISVKTIIDASHTSRTTFYRYFHDKYDVITWIYISQVDRFVEESNCFSELTLRIFRFMYENRDFFISAFSYEQQNSLVDYMAERSLEDCLVTVRETLNTNEIPHDVESSVAFFVAGCINTWHRWVSHGMKDTPEYVLSVIMNNMPERLHRFFK